LLARSTHAEGLGNTILSRVFDTRRNLVNKSVGQASYFEGRKESQMIQLLAARIQLAKMRAEEGQALVEYALIVSLIAVVAIAALTLTGTNIKNMLNGIAGNV
jgi:pilus assembly protein Flp/PilA